MAGNHPEDEAFRLVFGASPLVPDEAEEIEPVLELPPVDVRMGPQEPFEESVDLVYGLHRVVFVRKVLRALDEDRKGTGDKNAYNFYTSYMGRANISIPSSLTVAYFESFFPNNSASA